MISYFDEQLSSGLHSYIAPTGRNVINPTHYISNGYVVFEPDIHYEIGYPGPSALKSIVPGVQMLVARGFVDPKRLALQGQSWGGYQTLYMITQTSMFAAAMAGAPVVDMFSAYGGGWGGSGSGGGALNPGSRGAQRGRSRQSATRVAEKFSPLWALPGDGPPILSQTATAERRTPDPAE